MIRFMPFVFIPAELRVSKMASKEPAVAKPGDKADVANTFNGPAFLAKRGVKPDYQAAAKRRMKKKNKNNPPQGKY